MFLIQIVPIQCYMRALFDYEPEEDTLLPCKEIGLPFKYGDILQVNQTFAILKHSKRLSSNINMYFHHF